LKSLKPNDGWSVDTFVNSKDEVVVTLRRRNIPLSNTGFTSIVYDENESACVVGITSIIGETNSTWFCRGLVLVEKDGMVARDQRDVRVAVSKKSRSVTGGLGLGLDREEIKEQYAKNKQKAKEALNKRDKKKENNNGDIAAENNTRSFSLVSVESMLGIKLSGMDTSDVPKLLLLVICAMTILRIILTFRFLVNLVILPLLVLYGIQSCPNNESFDAKKELKRVLRR